MADPWFSRRLRLFEPLLWVGLAGLALIAGSSLLSSESLEALAFALGFLCFAPFLVYLVLVPIWHWKDRYRGEHSDLRGALLVIEVSGWFKVVYWFRHILPDWRGRGRYARGDQAAA